MPKVILRAGERVPEEAEVRFMGEWIPMKYFYEGLYVGKVVVDGDWVFRKEEDHGTDS